MSSLPRWMPVLLKQLVWGCANSPLLAIDDNDQTLEAGRRICRELWIFIRMLPDNISSVRSALPPKMDAAAKLLNELADDEHVYQQLFIKQCLLAGLKAEELASIKVTASTQQLCDVMTAYCNGSDYRDGILAVVTAELAATSFARCALPIFEKYFSQDSHSQQEIEEGLAWLRLHNQPHTKHALWLKHMLADLKSNDGDELPKPVKDMLKAIYVFWQCSAVNANSAGSVADLATYK